MLPGKLSTATISVGSVSVPDRVEEYVVVAAYGLHFGVSGGRVSV